MRLEEIKKAALPACRKFDVSRLDAFGSTIRGSATPSSDVDLLVEFKDPAPHAGQAVLRPPAPS